MMLKKMTLITKLLVVSMLLYSCGDSTENNNVNDSISNEKNDETVEANEVAVGSHEEFIEAFTELENLPSGEDFKNIEFAETDYKTFYYFTSYIKGKVYADYSEEEWHLKPLGKYKINNADHLLFLAEDIADTVIIRTIVSYKTDNESNDFWYAIGMTIMKLYPDGTHTSFKFIDNNADALNIYTDTNNKQFDLYVLNEHDYYNMSRYVKITAQSKVPSYSFSQFCGLFPKIDNNWKSEEQIKKLRTKSSNDDFSVFIHKKTTMGDDYISEPVDFSPRYSPLGYKQINDSLHLLVLMNHQPDHNECELKLVLLKNFDEIIEERYISNNDYVRTNISYSNNALVFEVKDSDKTFNLKLLCDKKGFLAEKNSFDKYFKKQLKFPFIADGRFLESFASDLVVSFGRVFGMGDGAFLGRLETKRFYLIVTYQGEEITSGSHSYAANVTAYLFNKFNLKYAGDISLYFYFSDGGDEDGSVLYPDRLYSKSGLDQERLDEKPGEKYLDKYLTNYGFIPKEYIVARKTPGSTSLKADLFNKLDNIQLPFKYKEIKIDNAKKDISDQNRYYSGIIDSLKFIDEPLESYVPLCLVKGKADLSDSTLLVVWQSWKKNEDENIIGEYIEILEKAIYNKNTGRFINHSEIPFNEDFQIKN